MQEITALFGIGTALAIGAASSGPSFVMVARTAIASSRADGIYAALGMGIGGLFFATMALLGLQGLLLAIPSLYWVLKVVGGLYLAYLGLQIWLGAKKTLTTNAPDPKSNSTTAVRSFVLGLTPQISNPKTAIVYASIFAAFMPAQSSLTFSLGLVCLVFLIETVWYALVALLLSSNLPRQAYLRYKSWIDRVAGGVMIALGFKLITSAERT